MGPKFAKKSVFDALDRAKDADDLEEELVYSCVYFSMFVPGSQNSLCASSVRYVSKFTFRRATPL